MKELFLMAEAGNAEVQARMAEKYMVRGDVKNALIWADLSAAQGEPMGLYVLGMCYLNGYSVEKDVEKARNLFKESADKGCHRALAGLACILFEEGRPFCKEALTLIRRAVAANDSKGQYLLALFHKGGMGVIKSFYKYKALLTQSAEQNFVPAIYDLSQLYLIENTPFYDEEKGLELLKMAAHQGFPKAEAHLAYLILDGKGVEKDEIKAFKMFQHAAEKGCAEAIRSLGFCYMEGKGVGKDLKVAGKHFKHATSLGLVDCEELAEIVLGGKQKLKEMIAGPSAKAEFELRNRVEEEAKEGNPEALYRLGCFYIYGKVDQWLPYEKDYGKARECLTKAANIGHIQSAYGLGCLLQYGYDNHAPNLEDAMPWYEFAAEQGHVEAMTNLAFCYQNLGNSIKAVEWLEKASEAGDTMAQGMLSFHYLYGIGIEENYKRAFELAFKSAEANEADGQKMLGLCYLDGKGVEQDIEKAVEYLTKAANQNNEAAMLLMGRLLMGDFGYENTDYEIAEELLSKVANMGNATAAYYLGILYHSFLNEPQMAFQAFVHSAKLGNQDAKDVLVQIIKCNNC